ncbi:glycoside hydrolase family 3 N-terminal domain-containing protein [Arthrobacter sp. H14-L1]|uniref:glycoside hydrolase family 3 N-terminal domain-containing protein n=1 Tax=Arthrobacter sp. H14-L1 TaxID=2996697 RepID=UPI002271D6F1|nr:glycoside hydrolase family 3 N-terminal domain-containing protein [Arthrobacter sp. H14-L1]MCY0904861.1 glycoside hydrolase family 3 protein [Arthrobacter sp. H14-L1]
MTETTDLSAAAPSADVASLRRLVNGVIWPGFIGTTVPAWLRQALTEGLAGVVYFSHNFLPGAAGQPAGLSAAIRAVNPLAVIGSDEEGGNVTRLQFRTGSDLPGAAVLGQLDDVALTEAAGTAIGTLCKAAGVNLVIGPVADVNTNPLNPVIGVRSFGADTDLVSRHTAAMVRGIQSTGIGACAKHFPGHGDTVGDSHTSLPRLEMTLDDVTRVHLPPFIAAAQAGAVAMMSAHIVLAELGEAPATLNPAAGDLLRRQGFAGLLVTDALDMAAIKNTVGMGRGAVLSLLAGADLLCVGNPANPYSSSSANDAARGVGRGAGAEGAGFGAAREDYAEVFDALLAAAVDGTLPVPVLERAAGRVAAFAARSAKVQAEPVSAAPTAGEWLDAAMRACTWAGPGPAPRLPAGTTAVDVVDLRTGHNMAAGAGENLFAVALADGLSVRAVPADQLREETMRTGPPTGPGEPCIVFVDALLDPAQSGPLADLARLVPDAICINAGLADSRQAAGAETPSPLPTINCFGSSRVSARAVARLLMG